MLPSERLALAGLELPTPVAPIGSYVPAKRVGDQIWTSGQLPIGPDGKLASGRLGAGVSVADGQQAARTAALNAVAAAAAVVGGVDRLTRVVKVTGFVASVPEFTGQPGVINGASEVLGEIFGDAGKHARAAVGVPVLPLDTPVEVEVTFILA